MICSVLVLKEWVSFMFQKKYCSEWLLLEALFLKAIEPVKGSKPNTEPIALGPSLVGSLVLGIYTMTDLYTHLQTHSPSADEARCLGKQDPLPPQPPDPLDMG